MRTSTGEEKASSISSAVTLMAASPCKFPSSPRNFIIKSFNYGSSAHMTSPARLNFCFINNISFKYSFLLFTDETENKHS